MSTDLSSNISTIPPDILGRVPTFTQQTRKSTSFLGNVVAECQSDLVIPCATYSSSSNPVYGVQSFNTFCHFIFQTRQNFRPVALPDANSVW